MIFVTLGTRNFQFNRLLKKLDELIDEKVIEEEVFAQISWMDYVPRNFRYVALMDKKEFEAKIEACTLLVTHGGTGSIISGVNHKKPVIVVPRLSVYREHIDDHQKEIASAFAAKNYVLQCNDMERLGELIAEAKQHTFDHYVSQRKKVVWYLDNYLRSL